MQSVLAKGPTLAVLAAVFAKRGISTGELTSGLEQTPTQTAESLASCEELHWIAPVSADRWGATTEGITAFYHTLGHIRDVLSPMQEAPTLPFTMNTEWRECVCLNYLVDLDILAQEISPVFKPVNIDGFGVVSVTLSSIVNMRPRHMPTIAGKSFCNASYRAVVSFVDAAGGEHVGYEFIKSATNSPLFTQIGNSITEFRFHEFSTGWIHFLRQSGRMLVSVEVPGEPLDTVVAIGDVEGSMAPPASSIFESREQLDRQVLNLNDAYGYVSGDTFVYILRIERSPWHYRFVEPVGVYSAFFQEGEPFGLDNARLDSVLHCSDISYRWEPLIKQALHPSLLADLG